MADSAIDGVFDLTKRFNYTTSTDYDPTINYWGEKEKYDKLYEDKSTLSFTDMLSLMVAQFQNQTMDNQASTTDMMNQLVQMSSMQAMTEMTSQIKELTLANVMSYAASLVGKTVTVGVWNEKTKELEEIVGTVQGTGTYDGQQVIYLDNGKGYFLNEIMAVGTLPPKEEEEVPGEGEGDVENPDGTEKPDDKVDQTPDTGTEDTEKEEDTSKVSQVDNDNAVG